MSFFSLQNYYLRKSLNHYVTGLAFFIMSVRFVDVVTYSIFFPVSRSSHTLSISLYLSKLSMYNYRIVIYLYSKSVPSFIVLSTTFENILYSLKYLHHLLVALIWGSILLPPGIRALCISSEFFSN